MTASVRLAAEEPVRTTVVPGESTVVVAKPFDRRWPTIGDRGDFVDEPEATFPAGKEVARGIHHSPKVRGGQLVGSDVDDATRIFAGVDELLYFLLDLDRLPDAAGAPQQVESAGRQVIEHSGRVVERSFSSAPEVRIAENPCPGLGPPAGAGQNLSEFRCGWQLASLQVRRVMSGDMIPESDCGVKIYPLNIIRYDGLCIQYQS